MAEPVLALLGGCATGVAVGAGWSQLRRRRLPKPLTPDERAEELLMGLLSRSQLKEWRHGWFVERLPSGRRVQFFHVGRVTELNSRGFSHTGWCIHAALFPNGWSRMPPADNLVALLLHARYDEAEFWRRANLR